VNVSVVVPCYRQERFLLRTVEALERSLAGHEWRGVLVLAAAGDAELPALGERWRVLRPLAAGPPLTPGAARMAGFAESGGEWVLFVDADVEMEPSWVANAIALAERARSERPSLGGLWGRIEEWMTSEGREWLGRRDLYDVGDGEHRSDYLATLAFYRREALERAGGYDPRLNSEEDFELGMRLAAQGVELRTLPPLAARHWSGPRPSFGELGRRWRAGLCFGQGQVLRLYLGRPGFARLLRRQALYIAAVGLWALGLAAFALSIARHDLNPIALWSWLPLAVLLIMAVRKRSPRLALHSLLSWTENGLGMLVGFFGARSSSEPAPVRRDRASAGSSA
jgi:Glycosyl transferase family 2